MQTAEIINFLEKTLSENCNRWAANDLQEISMLQVPDSILGFGKTLLNADIHILWARWFLEMFCDPNHVLDKNEKYAYVYKKVIDQVSFYSPHISTIDKRKISSLIAKMIFKEVKNC